MKICTQLLLIQCLGHAHKFDKPAQKSNETSAPCRFLRNIVSQRNNMY